MLSKIWTAELTLSGIESISTLLSDNKIAKSPSSLLGCLLTL